MLLEQDSVASLASPSSSITTTSEPVLISSLKTIVTVMTSSVVPLVVSTALLVAIVRVDNCGAVVSTSTSLLEVSTSWFVAASVAVATIA